jgi:hypothetical protein
MRNGCAVVVVFGVPVDGRRGAPSPPANQTIDVLIGNREKQKKEGRGGGGRDGKWPGDALVIVSRTTQPNRKRKPLLLMAVNSSPSLRSSL